MDVLFRNGFIDGFFDGLGSGVIVREDGDTKGGEGVQGWFGGELREDEEIHGAGVVGGGAGGAGAESLHEGDGDYSWGEGAVRGGDGAVVSGKPRHKISFRARGFQLGARMGSSCSGADAAAESMGEFGNGGSDSGHLDEELSC